jgi:hypothetical protein
MPTTVLDGKKTYIVALIIAGIAFAQAMGYPVPNIETIYYLLTAAGLGTLRDAIAKKDILKV